jgi:5-methylcytosine-specific restriction endonuclease McrA
MFLHREPVKKPVLLLNSSYEVLGRIPFNDAMTKIVTDKAWIFESISGKFVNAARTPDGGRRSWPWPVCIVLNEYVSIPYDEITPLDDIMAARMAILNRDNWKCGYCGDVGTTYDHIYPKSRGGENTWENLITACTDCNGFKADRTPEEAQRYLLEKLKDHNLSDEDRALLPKNMIPLWTPKAPKADRYEKEQNRIWKMLESNDQELASVMEDET